MIDWLTDLDPLLLLGGTVSAILTVVGGFLATRHVATLPADWFLVERPASAARQLLGGLFLFLGVGMLVLPGPGLLTLLAGVGMLEFPGKREFVLTALRRPPIRRAFDQLRANFGQGPLLLDPAPVPVRWDPEVF